MSLGVSASSFSPALNAVPSQANISSCLPQKNELKNLMQKVRDFVFSKWGLGLIALTISSFAGFNFLVTIGTFTSLAFIFTLYANNASFSFNTLHLAFSSAKNLGWQNLALKILIKMKQINPLEPRLKDIFVNAACSNDIQIIKMFTQAYETMPVAWLEIALLNASIEGNIEILRLLFQDANVRSISLNSIADIILSASNIETRARITGFLLKCSLRGQ